MVGNLIPQLRHHLLLFCLTPSFADELISSKPHMQSNQTTLRESRQQQSHLSSAPIRDQPYAPTSKIAGSHFSIIH